MYTSDFSVSGCYLRHSSSADADAASLLLLSDTFLLRRKTNPLFLLPHDDDEEKKMNDAIIDAAPCISKQPKQ